MSFLLLGDSHTNIFYDKDVNIFPLNKCSLDLFTTKRFLDDSDIDLWYRLTPWLENNKGSKLIITSGEIDIRAHYWRHIPRYYNSKIDIINFISSMTNNFYNKLINLAEQYNLDRIVVWGSPISGEKALYNSQYPFVGSSKTRNILTHLWNREFIKLLEKDSVISFSTAFYNFLETDYQTSNNNPSHDGVHWHNSQSTYFWKKFIFPATETKGIYLEHNSYFLKSKDEFDICEVLSQGNYRYDSWVRTNQINSLLDSKTVTILNNSYTYYVADKRNLLPDTYYELSLDKI